MECRPKTSGRRRNASTIFRIVDCLAVTDCPEIPPSTLQKTVERKRRAGSKGLERLRFAYRSPSHRACGNCSAAIAARDDNPGDDQRASDPLHGFESISLECPARDRGEQWLQGE